ncbi:MAG: hypothetical protein V1798_02620 [Pseudomonadota bacterium]
MTTPGTPAKIDGEIPVKLSNDPAFLEKLKSYISMGTLVIPKTVSFPMLSRVLVRFGDEARHGYANLLAEVVHETPGDLILKIVDFKDEERAKLAVLLKDLSSRPVKSFAAAPAPAPAAVRPVSAGSPGFSGAASFLRMPSLAPEGDLDFDPSAAMLRKHHEGKACLSEPNLFSLLFELLFRKFTGRLVLRAGQETAETYLLFKDGRLVGVDRNPIEETQSLGYLLRRNNRITEAEFRELRRKRDETKKLDQELLAGKIDVREIGMILVQMSRQIVAKIAPARPLHYRLEEGAQHLGGIAVVPLNLKRIVFRGIYDAIAMNKSAVLLLGLEPFFYHYVVRTESPPFPVGDLKLERDEQRFWSVSLEKPTRLRPLFSVSAVGKLQTIRMVYALAFLNFIDFTTNVKAEEEDLLPVLRQTVEDLDKGNHFDVLMVHWTALQPAVEAAYARTKKEWGNFPIPSAAQTEAQELLGKILKKIEDSYAFLSVDSQRKAYRDELIEPSQREFTAELLAEHANSDLYRGNRTQARLYLEMAVDLDPRSSKYRQMLNQAGGR